VAQKLDDNQSHTECTGQILDMDTSLQYMDALNVCPVLRVVRLLRADGNDGAITGVGISFVKDLRWGSLGPYMITETFRNSPALRCGEIQAGDFLFSVDGVSVIDKDANAVTALILGQPCTPVVLAITSCVTQEHTRFFEKAMLRSQVY
jgi:hypothetical protein